MYLSVGKKIKADLLTGNAVVLFAYGLSGSGKTFTVFGPDAVDEPEVRLHLQMQGVAVAFSAVIKLAQQSTLCRNGWETTGELGFQIGRYSQQDTHMLASQHINGPKPIQNCHSSFPLWCMSAVHRRGSSMASPIRCGESSHDWRTRCFRRRRTGGKSP